MEKRILDQHIFAAVAFLTRASSGNIDEAYEKYVAARFKHHNPFFEGFAESPQAVEKRETQKEKTKIHVDSALPCSTY